MSSITYNKITINNYKSLHDFKLDINKLNVLVGHNGSGKTNVVDAFITLKEIVRPPGYPPLPFPQGYDKFVLFNDVSLDISYVIEGEYERKKFMYYISFNGLTIKEERLRLGNETYERVLDKLILPDGETINIPSDLSMLNIVRKYGSVSLSHIPLDLFTLNFFTNFLEDIVVLKIITQNAVAPVPFNIPPALRSDGYGLPKILQYYKYHPAVETFLEDFNISLSPIISEEGNIILYVREKVDGKEIHYPASSLPAGIVKMLVILVAIYMMNSSLIVLDEVESSLHPELIRKLYDVIRESKQKFIVTTHSPELVDIVNVEDIVILEKINGITKASRIQNADSLRKKLEESGVYLSDWLF